MPAKVILVKRLQIQPPGRPGVDRSIRYYVGEPDEAQRRLFARQVAIPVPDRVAAINNFTALHTAAKEAVANNEVAKFLDQLDRREQTRKDNGKLFEVHAEDWYSTCISGSDLKQSEIDGVRSVLDHHLLPYFGRRFLLDIDTRAVDQYKAQKLKEKHRRGTGYAPATVNNHLSVGHRAMAKAIEWNLITVNPFTGRWVRDGLKEVERAWWLPEEQQRVVAYLRESWRTNYPGRYWPIMIGLIGGLRFGELKGLQRQDIDVALPGVWIRRAWARNSLSTPKNRRARPCILPRTVANELSEWSRTLQREHLFAGVNGGLLPHETLAAWYDALAKEAGVRRITSHGARHSAGSGYGSLGAGQRSIALLLGHENLSSTERYVHASVSMVAPLVEERWESLSVTTKHAGVEQ